MRDTDWTPSIGPGDEDRDVCLVVSDFGRRGRAWCETDVEATDLETVIQDLLDGQYSNPVRVVSFNTAEGWSGDMPTSPQNSGGAARSRRARSSEPARLLRASRTVWSDGCEDQRGQLIDIYRRRATAMPSRNAIARAASGASRTRAASISRGIPGFRPVSIAWLTRWLAD
jgi:hypothetical protein